MVLLNKIRAHTRTVICIVIISITFIAYAPIRHNDFVSYDDPKYITDNPYVTEGIQQDSVIWAFTQTHAANWHPITWMSHILDYQIFGNNPLGHHLVSLLFHIANAVLLFWILANITGTTWTSAFVAVVFALHPIQVESVAWVAERKTILSGLFWLLTVAAYIRYTKQPSIGRYALLFLVFGFCILTKPVVVTLPFVLLLLDYWPLGRVKWGLQIVEKIPLFMLSAILSFITFFAQRQGGAVVALERMPLDSRIANMFISYIRYIGKTIWPSRLAVFYPLQQSDLPTTLAVACAFLFILITVLSISIGYRRRYIAVGWLWYVGTLFPTIGLVQAGAQAMANRYMYMPIVGLLIVIAWAAKDFFVNRLRWRTFPALLTAALLFSMVILTRMQVRHWQNSLTLFEHTLKVTENNSIAENSYGCALFESGRDDEALLHLNNAVRISPVFFEARNNLGKVFLKKGKLNEAIACFNEIINHEKASAEVNYSLAVALSMQKEYDAAAKYFSRALEMDSKYPEAHRRMGAVLLAAGKAEEAIPYLIEALRINPEQAEVCEHLGTAYTLLGKYEEAVRNLAKAVELQPNNTSVLNNLAWLLAAVDDMSIRETDRAVEFATRACELTAYKEPEYLDTLAVAYAAAGRFDEALATAKQAVNIAKVRGNEKLVSEIQGRIELYQEGRSYIQK